MVNLKNIATVKKILLYINATGFKVITSIPSAGYVSNASQNRGCKINCVKA
jgi:hypothetical protein